MKSLKNKETLVFILAVFMMAAFCLTACTKDTDKEVQNESKEEVQNETDKARKILLRSEAVRAAVSAIHPAMLLLLWNGRTQRPVLPKAPEKM